MLLHHVYTTTLAVLAALPCGILATSFSSLDRYYSADQVIKQLGLQRNDEKGQFIQTFEDPTKVNNRTISTAIYYFLEGRENQSVWHRLDAYEVWHYYAGSPLTLSLSWDNGSLCDKHTLGPDIFNNQKPQVVVPKGMWQSARSLGNWTLVGTTMAPGFLVSGAELMPGWQPKNCC